MILRCRSGVRRQLASKQKSVYCRWCWQRHLCSSPVWAEEATFTANFKDTDLKSFIETVGANLNKTIIMGPGVQGKVSIRTMTPLNERQYYQLFLNLLEAQGYAVVQWKTTC